MSTTSVNLEKSKETNGDDTKKRSCEHVDDGNAESSNKKQKRQTKTTVSQTYEERVETFLRTHVKRKMRDFSRVLISSGIIDIDKNSAKKNRKKARYNLRKF